MNILWSFPAVANTWSSSQSTSFTSSTGQRELVGGANELRASDVASHKSTCSPKCLDSFVD
jgi:hypothetical protein